MSVPSGSGPSGVVLVCSVCGWRAPFPGVITVSPWVCCSCIFRAAASAPFRPFPGSVPSSVPAPPPVVAWPAWSHPFPWSPLPPVRVVYHPVVPVVLAGRRVSGRRRAWRAWLWLGGLLLAALLVAVGVFLVGLAV